MTPESNFNLGVLAVGTLGIEKASLPAVLRAAQTCRYLVYSEADFEVFALQGRHVAPMGVKFGTEEGTTFGPLLRAKSVQRQGCRTPKIEIFTQI